MAHAHYGQAGLMKKIEICSIPYRHIFIESFLTKEHAEEILDHFPKENDPIWDLEGKKFFNKYGRKKEISSIEKIHPSYQRFIDIVSNVSFLQEISNLTEIDDLFFDFSLYGGGLNLYEPGSALDPHVDFNFNDQIKMYRAVNLIYYLNKDWKNDDGGQLLLCSSQGDTVKKIPPIFNSCVIFMPNNKTIHSVEKVRSKCRQSISVWYYTKNPPKDVDGLPSKTKWI